MQSKEFNVLLQSIIVDMNDWPEHMDGSTLQSVDLLGAQKDRNGCWRYAIVLSRGTEQDDRTWWTLVCLHKRYLHFNKKEMWFYLITPDGSEAPFEGYTSPPIQELVEAFISRQLPDCEPVADCSWIRHQLTPPTLQGI